MRYFRSLLVTASLMVLFATGAVGVALAQDGDTMVDFDPFIAEIMPYVLTLLSVVASAAIAWVTMLIQRYTGITIEARHREALQSALLNGARAAITKVTPSGVKIDVKNATIADGIEYVLKSVPDALKYFELDEVDLARMIEAKLPAAKTPVVESPDPRPLA